MQMWLPLFIISLCVLVASIESKKKQHYIELLVAVDKTMEHHHKKNVNKHILSILSTTSKVLSHHSTGSKIKLTVKQITTIKNDLGANDMWGRGKDVFNLLKNFCHYVQTQRKLKYDAALLLTRHSFCQGAHCGAIVGLANLGTMCGKDACAVVQDIGQKTGYTITHELGHVFNCPHDDTSQCSKYSRSSHVMASSNDGSKRNHSWSKCSRHYITKFLKSKRAKCLANKPHTDMLTNKGKKHKSKK